MSLALESGAMPQTAAARAAINVQLEALRERLLTLRETFREDVLTHACDAELADLRQVGQLVNNVHAAGSLRVLAVMIESNAKRVGRLEDVLATYGPGAKLVS
jgi:hypothetical protein